MKNLSAILWRLYYIIITVMILSGIMYSLSGLGGIPDLYLIQFIAVHILALIALHGYITKRAYFVHTLWKLTLFWYLAALAFELYLFLDQQLIPNSMLRELLLITTGLDVTFGFYTRVALSVLRDGMVLPLLLALFMYTRHFRKIATIRQAETSS